jgi:phosphoribosylglycinamide formyltransferase 1
MSFPPFNYVLLSKHLLHKGEDMKRLRLAVLISGSGTNLQSLLDRSQDGRLAADVVVVISDNFYAQGLLRASAAKIPAYVVNYKTHHQEAKYSGSIIALDSLDQTQRILKQPDKALRLQKLAGLVRAEKALIDILDPYELDYICLAGFTRLVSPYFINHYNSKSEHRIINIHPAMLPSFPGLHGYEDTLAYGCRWGGVTVHFVDSGEDTGPIIAQSIYPIWRTDDVDSIRKRGLQLEYELYAQCINWLAEGKVEILSGGPFRTSTLINDEDYPQILKNWVDLAFSK